MVVRGGRYELLGAIASGGMATVHLARALGVGGFERFVAVKVMHQNLADEQEFVSMFLDEARLAARIRHPNVVGTLDVQEDELGLFLVMEYVEGPSLHNVTRALAKAHEIMPIEIALRIFVDALSGLHAAHELNGADGEPLNLVHRDVSPHNILIGADGVAQITDFGVARAESRLHSTKSGVVKGKVSYMAPEQIRSQPLDRRTDIYSAGALLWELLTGKRRIQGDSEAAMMHQILDGQVETPRAVNPAVPEAISDACTRALETSADDRYRSASAFADAVEQAATIEGITIASTRALAAFIKRLGIDRPSPQSLAASTGSKSRDIKIPAPTPSARTGPLTPPEGAGALIEDRVSNSTHAAIVAGGIQPRGVGARWPALLGIGALLAVGVWLFTFGPLKVSFRGGAAKQPTATPTTATSAPTQDAAKAAAVVPPVITPVPVTATAAASESSAPTAAPATSAPKQPKQDGAQSNTNQNQNQNPAGFRPKEL